MKNKKYPGEYPGRFSYKRKISRLLPFKKNGSEHCSFSSFFPAAAFIKLCLSSSIQTVTVGTGLSPDQPWLSATGRGLYRQWGLAPRPEDFLSLFFSISIYPVRNAVNRKIRLILLPHDCCALFHKVFPC